MVLPIIAVILASPLIINALIIAVGIGIFGISLTFFKAFIVNQLISVIFLIVSLIASYMIAQKMLKGKLKPLNGFVQIGLLLLIGILMPEFLRGIGLMSIALPVMSVTGSSVVTLPFNIPTTNVIIIALIGYALYQFKRGVFKL